MKGWIVKTSKDGLSILAEPDPSLLNLIQEQTKKLCHAIANAETEMILSQMPLDSLCKLLSQIEKEIEGRSTGI